MPRFRIRRFNQAKVERAFRAREKGEQETTVKKPHGRLPWWLGGGVSASAGDTTRDLHAWFWGEPHVSEQLSP